MRTDIKKLLREAAEKSDTNKEGRVSGQYDRIQRLLNDNMFNHSEIIDKLWGVGEKEDASKRSLFRKKLNRAEYQGTRYEFNNDELDKISQILMSTSAVIRKNLGKTDK